MRIYPGGITTAAEGMVSLDLWNMSNKAIEIIFGLSINDGSGKQVAYIRTSTPRNIGPVQSIFLLRAVKPSARDGKIL